MPGMDPAVKKETGYITVWVVLLSLVMEAVFLLIRKWDLSVLFGKPDKAQYIDIIKNLAQEKGIAFDEELLAQAESFAISRGGRSPRCARQFIAAHEAAALNKNE